MILLRVIDQSGPSGPYRMTGSATLRLSDDVKVIKRGDKLALVDKDQIHLFNNSGEYIGTEQLDKRQWHSLGDDDPPGVE